MPEKIIKANVYRFDLQRDKGPRFERYEVPYVKHMRVMDVLDYIYENFTGISYRWFCGVKRCGLCGVMVNGRPVLACWEAAQDEMVVEPLRNFPVIKDLVVDRAKYDAILSEMKLELIRGKPYSGFPEPLKHEDMNSTYHLWDCIECMICMSACDVLAKQNFEKTPAWSGFVGPAPMVQLARYALDARDEGDRARLAVKGYIDQCASCNSCSTACPNHIRVLQVAIDGLRDEVVSSGAGYIRGWRLIKRIPPKLRRILRCKLNLTLGEGVSTVRNGS